MGRIGIVRLVDRVTKGDAEGTEVVVDMGGGENVRVDHFETAGGESYPSVGDYAFLVDGPGTGREVAVAYADPRPSIGAPGDTLLFARSPSNGVRACQVWLKADGTISITAPQSYLTFDDQGNIEINGVVIDNSGNITTTGTITAAQVVAGGKSLAVHTHPSANPPAPTGPNT